MRIVVCVKQVEIVGDDFELSADARSVDPDFLDFALNEWDWYATEAALRLREAHGGEVVVTTVGTERADTALRRCLAMGADRAIRVSPRNLAVQDPLAVAHALAEIVREESPDLAVCGVQASDSVDAATGAALAGLLGWPVVTVVTGLTYDLSSGRLAIRRELEGGLIETVTASTPAVLTIQTGINEPRYATLRAIKQAEQKPLVARELRETGWAGAVLQRMYVPVRGAHAEMLEGSPPEVARQLADLVKQKVGR
jgi:electron transfer flavoprotein beta subunit